MAVNTAYLDTSAATTVFSSLSVAGTAEIGVLALDGAIQSASAISGGAITGTTGQFNSTVSIVGKATLDDLSVSTGAGSTITVATDVTAGCLFVTVGASGLSVGVRSANSLYWINSTVSSA